MAQPASPESAAIAAAIADENFTEAKRLLDVILAARPGDPALRFSLARTLAWSGCHDDAVAQYDWLIDRFPDNVDYVLGRAQAHTWAGRFEEAFVDLERARELAPDYEAVWELLYRVALQLDRPREQASVREAAATRFPEADWWHETGGEDGGYRRQLSVGARHESLSDDLPSWSGRYLRLNWGKDESRRYFAEVARDGRFGESDTAAAVGGDWQLGGAWFGGLAVSSSPDASFAPRESLSMHGGRRFARGWVLDLAVRQRRYSEAVVSTYTAAMERYFGNYRAAYSLNLSHLRDAGDSVAHVASIGWYAEGPWSLALALAVGNEAEAVGPDQVLETEIESLTLNARRRLTARLSMDWWLGTHEQGDLYRRRYAGMALTYGF